MASLDDADVQALARACRLALTRAQVADHREQLAPLVDHLARLAAVDVQGVLPYTPEDGAPRLRDDSPGACLPVDAVTASAPLRRGDLVAAPRR